MANSARCGGEEEEIGSREGRKILPALMIFRVINTVIIIAIILLAIAALFIVPLTAIFFGVGPT